MVPLEASWTWSLVVSLPGGVSGGRLAVGGLVGRECWFGLLMSGRRGACRVRKCLCVDKYHLLSINFSARQLHLSI